MRHIRVVLTTIMLTTAVLAGTIVLYVLTEQGRVAAVVPAAVLNAQGAGFDSSEFGSAIRFLGLSTLAAAGPLAAAAAVAPSSPSLPSRRLSIVAAVLAVWAAVVGGRQAIVVVTLVAPVAFLLVQAVMRPHERRRLLIPPSVVIASPVIFLAGLWAWSSTAGERFRAAVSDVLYVYVGVGNGSGVASADNAARSRQASELVSGWSESPIFGSGLGAVLPDGYIRSARRHWMFELQYHQLLFYGGLVAVVTVVLMLVVAGRGIIRAARLHPEHLPTVAVASTAALGLLVANASNPYLQAVGHWWGVALVLGVANALLREPPAAPEAAEREPVTAQRTSPS